MISGDGGGELASYTDLADTLEDVGLLLRSARRSRRLSLRDAGAEMGMSWATVSRIERGEGCVLSNAVAVLRWLDDATPVPDDAGHSPE